MAPGSRELAFDDRPSVGERLVVLLVLEPLPNLGSGTVARDVAELRIQPVQRRPALLHREDVDALPVAQPMVQRNHLPVHARAAAAMAEIRVHRVREIDRRGTARQVDDLALRREHVDRVGEQALLEAGQPFAGVGDRVLPVEDLPQPRDLLVEAGIAPGLAAAAFLVAPVRGHAVLGMLVHVAGADLHFERLAFGPDDGGVQ